MGVRGQGSGEEAAPSAGVMWQWAAAGAGTGAPGAAARRAGRDAGRGRGGASPVTERQRRGQRGRGAPRGGCREGQEAPAESTGLCRLHPCLFRRKPSASSFLEEGRLKNAMYNVAIHKPGLARDWGSLYSGCYVENCRDWA